MKEIKVEWCMNFIRKKFEKLRCKGIMTGCFWDMAERSGLWERGTYGTPMSEALEALTEVGVELNEDGQRLYTYFRLKEVGEEKTHEGKEDYARAGESP